MTCRYTTTARQSGDCRAKIDDRTEPKTGFQSYFREPFLRVLAVNPSHSWILISIRYTLTTGLNVVPFEWRN